jgi:hypothetical protein
MKSRIWYSDRALPCASGPQFANNAYMLNRTMADKRMKCKNFNVYRFHVARTADGEEFIGRCDDFPHLYYKAAGPAGALRGIMEMVDDIDEETGYEQQAIAA